MKMHKTDWMYERKWGVFLHYLEGAMNHPEKPRSMGRHTSWDECIEDFDCDLFAYQLHEAGAGWLILTLMQQTKYLLAPNETFNQLTGYQNGEACPKVDFVERMYQALAKYDIALLLYFTGDGPIRDERASKIFPLVIGEHMVEERKPFVENWAAVAREYSMRYGDKIKGWWQDGCWIGYTEKELAYFADAFRAGNPDAVVAQNVYGCLDHYGCQVREVRKCAMNNEFTAGELIDFGALPYGPFVNQSRWHILSFLGEAPENSKPDGWGKPGCKYTPGWMFDYVDQIHRIGGIITIDICGYRDGHIDPEQLRVLRVLKTV